MTDPLWQPSDQRIVDANLTAFMQFLAMDMDEAPSTFEALLAWSVDQTEDFWSAFWRFSKVKSSKAWDHVLTDPGKMPGAKWFDGARLNFAEKHAPPPRRSPRHHRLDRRSPAAIDEL